MLEELRGERCKGPTVSWKVGSDGGEDMLLNSEAVKSVPLICSDSLMLCYKLPPNLVSIKQLPIILKDLGEGRFK